MKIARIGLFVFAMPFAAFGIGFFVFMVYPELGTWVDAQSWQPARATLTSAKLQRNHSSKSTTYEATATYRYQFNGREYTGTRVALSDGGDNIGSFQENLGRQLERLYQNQQPVAIWVNPENPSQALVNRELRWGLLSLKMIFVVAFAGIGLALMIGSFKVKSARQTSISSSTAETKPWLTHKTWASPVIRSGARQTMWILWGFAIFWNAITLPITINIPDELQKGEWGVLFVLIFNVIGIGIVVMALRKTLEWRRFGTTLLTMDPHPGAIGGQVGGYVDIKLPFRPGTQFSVVLSNIYSYMSGSGKNRSRREKVIWQDKADIEAIHGMQGSRIQFCFDVPDNLHPSEPHASKYHKWTVEVHADLPGINLDRSFEIPVFPTQQRSAIAKSTSTMGDIGRRGGNDVVDNSDSDSPVRIREHPANGGLELVYPPGRARGVALVLGLVGSIFMAIGVFVAFQFWSGAESSVMAGVMGALFFIVGLLMDYGSVYTLINSLHVLVTSGGIKTIRKLAGVPLFQRNVTSQDISDFKVETGVQSGNKVYYRIFVDTRQGRRIKIGESLIGASNAERIVTLVKAKLGR